MLWVNFKLYQEAFAQQGVILAQACRRVSKKTGVKIIPLVSALDLWRVKTEVGGEVWLQHLDLFFEGQYTGWISPLAAILIGAKGALLNHSEHKIPPGKIRQILAYLKKEKWQEKWLKEIQGLTRKQLEGFQLMICIKTKGQAERWLKKLRPRPEFVAYEPPELIGGEVSVTQAHPQVIERMVKLLPRYQLIVGAGIKTKEDVRRALALGAKGVLVSSAVIKAKNPEKKLLELAQGFNEAKIEG